MTTLPKTIIFDLSEVFIAGLPGIERELARRAGVEADSILRHFWGDHLWSFCRGHLTEDEYLTVCCREAPWTLTRAEVRAIIRANFERKVADMEPLLHELRDRYELALLSDHAREWVEHIRVLHPFLAHFSSLFFSFDIGAVKAEPACFEHVLRQLDRAAHECLFIDDTERNVAVATSLGIPSIQFTNAAALRHELSRRGILASHPPSAGDPFAPAE